MELWFILAFVAAIMAGIAAFTIKVVAKHNYNSELYIFNSAIAALILTIPFALLIHGVSELSWFAIQVSFIGGALASIGQIFKVYALRHIDTTIYFPLFKLVSPFLVIVFSIIVFQETFSPTEWTGLVLGLLVPLMLITKAEHIRQNDLMKGLILVLVTGVISAIVAGINKYTTDLTNDVFWIMVAASFGVLVGSFVIKVYKKGFRNFLAIAKKDSTFVLVFLSVMRAFFISASFAMMLYSFVLGGALGVVYTIQSMYILIPIVLSIIFYKEHWNIQKAAAIILSVAALALLG